MSKWYSFEELKRARTPMPLDSVTGLPDNHVITVVERVISVDNSELIQNNVRTDTVTLDLDAEYDDLNVIIIFTKPNNINVQVAYSGQPVHIPGSVMELTGSVAVSVVGLDAEGETRAVTKAAPDTFQVVASGAYTGKISQDDADLLGQILQAVSDTETAITAAETATTAATNATSQATSAATSANQAASSANTAASSANSAATKANSAAVDAQNAYDTLQPYMATIDSCANILHREVGPDSVVTADDSFPCKPVEMTVYGNTVQNLWVNPSGTKYGVVATSNDDGSVTVSGTATIGAYIVVGSYALKPRTQYTLSIDKMVEGARGFYVDVYDESGTSIQVQYIGGSQGAYLSATFTLDNRAGRVLCGFGVNPGQTVSGTYRVMLNEGSEAQPWCPPGLNSVGQLRKDEKNLWVNPDTETKTGVTLTANDDGTITLNGTNTGGLVIQKPVSGLKPNTTYYLDWDRDLPIGYFCVGVNGGAAIKSSRGTFTTGSDTSNLVCAFVITSAQDTATFSGTYKVMLNEGSTAQPWVAPGTESAAQVVTAGKNLSIVDNIGSSSADYNTLASPKLAEGIYTVSGIIRKNTAVNIRDGSSSGDIIAGNVASLPKTLSIKAGQSIFVNAFNMGQVDTSADIISNFQLELGSTATPYEPPNITTTPIDLQGHTLNALPDGTRDELHIDGGGNVVLEKRVFRSHVEADSLTAHKTKYSEMSFGTGCDYADGTQFASDSQKNDFAPVRNADNTANSTSAAVYTRSGVTHFRAGDGAAQASAEAQLESIKSKIGTKGVDTMWKLAEPQTIDLGTITPPTMAAPNVTAYVADDTPAEMKLDYVRDINIVVDRLEKKVADLVVTEATYV